MKKAFVWYVAVSLVLVGIPFLPLSAVEADVGKQDVEIAATPVGFASVNGSTTGGAGGSTVTVSNATDLINQMQATGPRIIQVSGTISLPAGMHRVASDKTIIGLGSNARITNGGFNLRSVNNIIIQNLTFSGSNDDAINVGYGSHHIWIDHNTFSNAYDGLVDINRQSSYVTVSWNRFQNHDKTSLVGNTDNAPEDRGHLKVTYHHNWFEGTGSRHPRVRFGEVHVFNNYYDAVRGYGIASTMEADVVVESNYFRNVSNPTHVGYGSSGPGDLVERNNVYSNSGTPETRGSAFNPPYSYSPDNAANVPDRVRNGAGAGKL
ncbi:pectate lyase family protein [Desmospora activa]|uniref:Pectate lyase n=1 Tax=Desmospora activa DSM 45169 TaxID=1121389 RepID=A0A2T4ZDM2_9BACL|nr:right-handed parallel beta-helix repeat-containing protein [Desmospora activa]PTM59989.1 pectate lyase [Desmospora activa DSM 45169]